MKYLFVLLVFTGCGGSGKVPDVEPFGGMLGLETKVDPAPWRSSEVVSMEERPALSGWVVFDARGINDPSTRELTWQVIAAVLTGISDDSMRMVQAELEPAEDVLWDLYFLVNQSSQREAVLWRMARATSPGDLVLNVLVERHAGNGVPDQVSLWVSTGVAEPAPVSLRYEAKDGCVLYLGSGISEPSARAEDKTCQMAHGLLSTLFTNVSGAGYLDDPNVETPVHHQPAELEIRDRQIDEVFSDSAFPPRWTR